ncbi:uncharacterized protein LOC124150738 [Haliotis rufescens]|uniref:uncharacterized protein LOC124150738 n=1 Tax=Haliotis rufescens TaxID=6454 RepID=UPI001EB0A11B|nr:uncharacterized protein LOC124150738 [Haliotis rufescens]XP_048246227.1 uncharacterized protein LOC124150738 [Haliotis rufescens]
MICGGESKVEDISPILDVQKKIQDWAWDQFVDKATFWRKHFIRRKDYDVDVPMNYYQFEDLATKLEDTKSKSEAAPRPKHGDQLPNTSILSTDYQNDTNRDQIYKFRMERARTASVNVTFQTGFSIGGSANFSIGVAEAGLETRLEISKTTGQTFEETLTFETTSDINVEANTYCTAQVVFTEKEICKKFRVETIMRMPSGSAPVFIRRKKDQELVSSFSIGDLQQIFEKQIQKKQIEVVDETERGDEYKKYAMKLTTTGIIEGMKLSGQTVKLHSEAIDKNKRPKKQTDSQVLADHLSRQDTHKL